MYAENRASAGGAPDGTGSGGTGSGGPGRPDIAPANVAEALRMADAAMDYLNASCADLGGAACGEVLTAMSRIQAKFAAAQAALLRRFDTANAHDADGCASSSAWLTARAGLSKKDARAAVRHMHQLGERPRLADALTAGAITQSWAMTIAAWTRKLPAALRDETDRIILGAAAAGASLGDLATIAGLALERWRSLRPDQDEDDDRFRDRCLRLGTTFGGAGVIRGDLTPECAAAVSAVLEALGKKRGPEDNRTQEQRFHDGLQEACQLLIRARMVPDRAGADTQVVVHIPFSQLRDLPGAPEREDAWIRAKLGEPGYLAGRDAEVAACDALTVPVVTGHADLGVIDQIIALALATSGVNPAGPEAGAAMGDPALAGPAVPGAAPAGKRPARTASTGTPSAGALQALRYGIARLAVDFVSGPGGLASALRTGLLDRPCNTPSLPLDIGFSNSIPGQIRRAVILRDKHCAWPGGCDRPPSASDVHHIVHKRDGGETSLQNLALLCEYHHEICIHRWGWRITLRPDGTMEARSPGG